MGEPADERCSPHAKATRRGAELFEANGNFPAGSWRKDVQHKMRTGTEGARKGTPQTDVLSATDKSAALLAKIMFWLDEAKAEAVVSIALAGKSSIGDYMVIASGRNDRHVGGIADQLQRCLKDDGFGRVRIEGKETCDWVLLDTGDIIIHVFRPEVREFYNLEKMWSTDRPGEPTSH